MLIMRYLLLKHFFLQNEENVGSMWANSGLDWSTFFASEDQAKDFLQDKVSFFVFYTLEALSSYFLAGRCLPFFSLSQTEHTKGFFDKNLYLPRSFRSSEDCMHGFQNVL